MALHASPVGSGPVAGIGDQTCLSCHAAVMTRIVTANGLSIQHVKCSQGRMCTDCHSDTAHGLAAKWAQTSDMFQCLDCHAALRSTCASCHPARTPEQRIGTGEWAILHGPNWRQTHGMGDLKTCVACHPDNFCERCHGMPLPHAANWILVHPATALTQRKDCAVCHKQSFCDGCHGLQMPHPKAFTPAHSTLVRQKGSALCLQCHLQDDCNNCHVRHVHPGNAADAAAKLRAGSGTK